VRLFLAINLPDETRRAIAEALAPLRDAAPRVAWVRAELLHVTMKFIGERDAGDVTALQTAAASAARTAGVLDLTLVDAGAFPNFRRPRVVWLDMRPPEPLVTLAMRTDEALATAGVPREERAFRPHLTVGRVKSELTRMEALALERAAGQVHASFAVRVTTIDLMWSALSHGGPSYTRLAAIPLGGA
jgi:2'-5' RNA ligase